MSYSTYERLPTIRTYAAALRLLTTIKPIRKAKSDSNPLPSIPLGERRDHNQFRLLADTPTGLPTVDNPTPDIEVLLYNIPALIFHPDNTITFQAAKYPEEARMHWYESHSKLFFNVLYRYISKINRTNGRLVITTADGNRHALDSNKAHRFQISEALNNIVPINPTVHTKLVINRAVANKVRAQYAGFFRYMKGLLGARKEVREIKGADKQEAYVTFTLDEFTQNLPAGTIIPVKTPTHLHSSSTQSLHLQNVMHRFDTNVCVALTNKPSKSERLLGYCGNTGTTKNVFSTDAYDKWHSAMAEWIGLISTPASDPEQHEKFYKAFVRIAAEGLARRFYFMPSVDKGHVIQAKEISLSADEALMKWHSEEVFERVQCKPNEVPTTKYDTWVTRDGWQ